MPGQLIAIFGSANESVYYTDFAIRAFRVYLGAAGFVNTFMEEFSPDAFDNRRVYITSYYLQENDHLDRAYPYLTEAEMDAFVENSVREIPGLLKKYGHRNAPALCNS